MREIHDALQSLYPDAYSPLLEPRRGNPVDVLVATILSQATNDTLSSRAFDALKGAFQTWGSMLDADPAEVERLLAVGGLQREKTKKIRAALRKIRDDFGRITLDPLSRLPPDTAYGYLTSLPGVGPKTAACVIGFGLGTPAFPVDTHVLRMARRLGLVPDKAGASKTQKALEAVTPPEIKMPLHVMMIRHGRGVCLPRKPRCQGCPLRDGCDPGLR
jgi:endonuclease-3